MGYKVWGSRYRGSKSDRNVGVKKAVGSRLKAERQTIAFLAKIIFMSHAPLH